MSYEYNKNLGDGAIDVIRSQIAINKKDKDSLSSKQQAVFTAILSNNPSLFIDVGGHDTTDLNFYR